jgi:penicillin G amidase
MKLTTREILNRLGQGERIADVCAAAGIAREEFDTWWSAECRRRVPTGLPLPCRFEIQRDWRGVPHVRGENDRDLFVGYGYAVAQDRLFQLDYLRHKARGRLAEILGRDAVESDVLYRTIGLAQIAEAEWNTLADDIQSLLQAYCDGINLLIEQTRDHLPIEFDLLDYRPEPWTPTDSLAVIGDFRWYLTGRFPVILIPELVKRALGDGPLYREFLVGEADEESILQQGEYLRGQGDKETRGQGGSCDDSGGSNNWVLDGKRTVAGKPLVASDPHVPFQAVSIWHEVHLQGGAFNVAGAALAGMPGVMIGRNEHVAWGVTNNICSQRDLYLEKTDADHANYFLFDGKWEPARERMEVIQVRGALPVRKLIRSSHNGPIVNHILPPAAKELGTVSLRWLGFEPCGWLTATINTNRARSCAEFREALRPWAVPTFNLVFADTEGNTGFQAAGRIPIRRSAERGLRPGWDPAHQWAGVIPFDKMPRLANPSRGFVVTANNRLAPDDYLYPLFGCWSSGYRARRIREQLEARARWTAEDCRKLQLDTHSGRAALGVPPLVEMLGRDSDARIGDAVALLKQWDCRINADSAAAAVFNVFFAHWCRVVVRERIPAHADFIAANAGGLAVRLLVEDSHRWFQRDRKTAAREALNSALDELTAKSGPDMAKWSWGAIHPLQQKHYLSSRGDLGQLLDRSGLPCPGDGTTVLSGTQDANHAAWLGASYRMVADLADPKCGISAIDVSGESGNPGSAHYNDQVGAWDRGELHYTPLK